MNKSLLFICSMITPLYSMNTFSRVFNEQDCSDVFTPTELSEEFFWDMGPQYDYEGEETIRLPVALLPYEKGFQGEQAQSLQKAQIIAQLINGLSSQKEEEKTSTTQNNLDQENLSYQEEAAAGPESFPSIKVVSRLTPKKRNPRKQDSDDDYKPYVRKRKKTQAPTRKKTLPYKQAQKTTKTKSSGTMRIVQRKTLDLLKELIAKKKLSKKEIESCNHNQQEQLPTYYCYEQDCKISQESHEGHRSINSLKTHLKQSAYKPKGSKVYPCPFCDEQVPSRYPSLILAYIENVHKEEWSKINSK